MSHILIYINGHPICPECYGDNFITDLFHDEIYCSECGLVVRDNTITDIRTGQYLQEKQDTLDAEIKNYLKSHPDYDC